MKNLWRLVRGGTALVLLVALVVGLVVLLQMASGGGPAASPRAQAVASPGIAITPPAPPPDNLAALATATAGPYPPPEETPTETATAAPYPPPQGTIPVPATATPTPEPAVTRGPSVTPFPTRGPAPDAAGVIAYAARENSALAFYSLPVDRAGRPQAPPMRVPIEKEVPWGLVYPAPDGRRVAIAGDWGITHILHTGSGRVEPLFRQNLPPGGIFLNWHPNSRQVLFRAEENYSDVGLWLVDTITGEHKALVERFPSAFDGGDVSPDGQKVVYTFWQGFGTPAEMWMANADGSDPRLLFTSERAMFALTWSPDGSKVAFIDAGLMVVEADGSNPRTLSRNFAVGYLFRPVWSPDSRTIAFVAFDGPNPLTDKSLPAEDRDTDAFKGTNIHLVDVLTGAERPLIADGSTGTIDPAWSPDGSQLVFASTRSGTSEVWAINADGTNLRQITTMGQLVRFPSWQRPQPPAKP